MPRPVTEQASRPLRASAGEISVSASGTPPRPNKSIRVKAQPQPVMDEVPSVVVAPQAHVLTPVPGPMPVAPSAPSAAALSAKEQLAEKLAAQLAEQLARTPGAPKLTPEQIRAFVNQQLAQQEAAAAAAAQNQGQAQVHQVKQQAPARQQTERPSQLPQATALSSSKSKSKSKSKSSKKSRHSSKGLGVAPQGGAVDPLAVPLPPELAPTIFSWIRRLALQADLTSADRVLRDGLAELTGAMDVAIVYPGNDGLFSLGSDEEVPRDMGPIVAAAQSRRAVVASHTALIPIMTSTETVAVILLTRNSKQSAFAPIEQLAMIALARESAAIIHHLAVSHLQKASEIAADKGSLYRGEALDAHRNRGNEGVMANLSPGWVKRAYPFLCGTILVGIVGSIFLRVPTYATGPGVISFDGSTVTAPAPGTVARVVAQPGSHVRKGDLLVQMASNAEQTQYDTAKSDRDDILAQHLYDFTDIELKSRLSKAERDVKANLEHLNQRNIIATRDGVIGDIKVLEGRPLQMGEPVATIVDGDKKPSIKIALPSKDATKLHPGMEVQVELTGMKKSRETAIITKVPLEAVGVQDYVRLVGASVGESFHLDQTTQGSLIIVEAELPEKTFKAEHERHEFYRSNMTATCEIKLKSTPFLATLIPSFEKYLPD